VLVPYQGERAEAEVEPQPRLARSIPPGRCPTGDPAPRGAEAVRGDRSHGRVVNADPGLTRRPAHAATVRQYERDQQCAARRAVVGDRRHVVDAAHAVRPRELHRFLLEVRTTKMRLFCALSRPLGALLPSRSSGDCIINSSDLIYDWHTLTVRFKSATQRKNTAPNKRSKIQRNRRHRAAP
jgi:hypothetical protein